MEVKGTVRRPNGDAVDQHEVIAYDIDLRNEEKLGCTLTDEDGNYSIRYTAKLFKRAEKNSADLELRTTDSSGEQKRSQILFNAPPLATIDLVIDGETVIGPSEYDTLMATLHPVLNNVKIEALVENQDTQEVSFLVGETGVDEDNLNLLVLSHQHSARSNISPDFFYGMLREGLPTEYAVLLALKEEEMKIAINAAIADNIIRLRSEKEILRDISQLRQLAVQSSSGQGVGGESLPPLGNLLKATLQDPKPFVRTLSAAKSSIQDFWKTLAEQPETKNDVDKVQLGIQLGGLSLNHKQLVEELFRQQSAGEIKGFLDLATFSGKRWFSLVNKLSDGVPADIPGESATAKKQTYVKAITQIVEDALPTQFLSARFADSDDDTIYGALPGKADLLIFLRNSPSFNVKTSRVVDFIKKNPKSVSGVKNPDQLKGALLGVQRLHAIAPRYTLIRPLLTDGVDSAMKISRMGETAFLAKYSNTLGRRDALQLFDRSQQAHNMAFNLLANFGSGGMGYNIPALRDVQASNISGTAEIPDWAILFGSVDMCSCDGCRAMDSPCAYLVDVLHYLKDRRVPIMSSIVRDSIGQVTSITYKTRTLPGTETRVDLNVKDVLFARRPDIGEIELTCENTNTPLPYIDIVIEILENAVNEVPFKPTDFPQNARQDLDAGRLDAIRDLFNPHLSQPALVNIVEPGVRWTIDDLAYTYTVQQDGPITKVTTRSRQTTGTRQERGANPQYVNWAAYATLARTVYPWALPYDFSLETVRTYLAHLTVDRRDVIESFSPLDRSKTLTDISMVYESLGLSTTEANIIKGAIDSQVGSPSPGIWNLWGFQQQSLGAQAWNEVLTGNVEVFLQLSGLKYVELLNLKDISSMFGDMSMMDIKAILGAPVDTCQLSKLQIEGANPQILWTMARFLRLWRKLTDWSIIDLGKAVQAFSPHFDSGTLIDTFLTRLSHLTLLKKRFGLPVETLLAFFSNLSTVSLEDHWGRDENPKPRSQYARIFHNRTILSQPSTVFTEDPSTLTGTVSQHAAAIAAALNVAAEDLKLMLSAQLVPEALSLTSISLLYRHTVLAQALELSTQDYLSLMKLIPVFPFADTTSAVLFVEKSTVLLNSEFSIPQLSYILMNEYVEGNGIGPTEAETAPVIDDLRASMSKINNENTFQPEMVDEKGDTLKKKLALLNMESTVLTQVMGTLNNTTPYDVQLNDTLPGPLTFPDGLRDKITYDPATLRLSFATVMTSEEQTTLLATPGLTPQVQSAVRGLFKAPRSFFHRNLTTYFPHDYTTSLATMPQSLEIPVTLRGKVFHDPASGLLHTKGALTSSEKSVLLTGVDEITDRLYIEAVNDLYNQPNDLNPNVDDLFLSDDDIGNLFNTTSDAEGPLTPQRRFEFVLRKLLPKILGTLSYQLLVQKFSQGLGLETTIVDLLLKEASYPGLDAIHGVFQVPQFAATGLSVRSTQKIFPTQFQAFALLKKIALIVTTFRLTVKQLKWLLTLRRLPNDPTGSWLQLDRLPLERMNSAGTLFTGWERLSALVKLRDSLPNGEDVLENLFSWVRDPTKQEDEVLKYLEEQTKWPPDDVKYLYGPSVFATPYPNSFKDEFTLTRILRCINLARTTGCKITDMKLLTEANQSENQARIMVSAVKSKYDQTTWETVARPLRNILREGQRGALVAYLLANPKGKPWRNSDDIYAHYLIDVEMGACQLTTRIKAAIGSTQLFVQRCLMNLEPEITANTEVDAHWDEWTWMKSQPIHGANYRVLIFPENYMEPSLRDDQTPFFKDFLNELQQADLIDATAEKAFRNYLKKLDEVSLLEVVSVYHHTEPDSTGHLRVDNFHVFARTRATPHHYFHRRRVDSLYWDPGFQKIEADIAGDHVFPAVWDRRLLLFWAIFERKQQAGDVKLPKEGESVESKAPYWEIKLAWSEFVDEKWSAKQISEQALVVPGFDEDSLVPTYEGRQQLTFKTAIDTTANVLEITCHKPFRSMKHRIRAIRTGIIGAFRFDGYNNMPSVVYFPSEDISERYLMAPVGTHITNMAWAATNQGSSMRLTTSDFRPGIRRPELYRTFKDIEVLGSTPDASYKLITAPQDEQFSSQRPFFFQHGLKTYFIEPQKRIQFINRPHILDPFLPDGRLFGGYIDKLHPLIPQVNLPYPSPAVVGAIRYPLSGPISGNIIRVASQVSEGLGSRALQRPVIPSAAASFSTSLSTRAALELESKNVFPIYSAIYAPVQYKFSLFYHRFVREFIVNLNRDGVDALLQRAVQFLGEDKKTFVDTYQPNVFAVSKDTRGEYAEDVVDFEDGSYAVYNWELFFHIPLSIADRLSKSQRFAEAQKWFHYIFDPTDASTDFPAPARYWKTKKLAATQSQQYALETVPALFQFLADQSREGLDPKAAEMLRAFETNVRQWRKEPFQPFLIARTRTTAFQKDVVMRYLDNLIAWGDNLFRADTIEKINEATQLYILAAEILGKRPEEIPRAIPKVQTYNSLEPNLDSVSNALVEIEGLVPTNTTDWTISPSKQTQAVRPSMLFFCVPRNDKLFSYWDTVADRLFKIRNCMNLQGIVRELALFEPKIDPRLLVKAAASGMDLSSAVSDLNAPLPHYRFRVWLQKAVDVCNELKSLGGALLSAIEKKDAEALALLKSRHEQSMNDALRSIRKKQVDDTKESLEVVKRSKDTVNERYRHYSTIEFMNAWELTSMTLESVALAGLVVESAALIVSGAAFIYPDGKIGAPTSIGVTFGGGNIGKAAEQFAAFVARNAGLIKQSSNMAVTLGSYTRRMDEWKLQASMAEKELAQIDKQITSAEIKLAIAEEDQKMHELQARNTLEVDDFMRRQKFTNRDLYDWMQGELTTLYFQHYGMAYDAAKRAERAYCYEIGIAEANWIKFGYWDGLKKGLLAGEKLMMDLKAMEVVYLNENRRNYEITTNISLTQLDALALIQLRENKEAFFALPEAVFDMAYPGHYMRRIKSISLTIPCVVGPYTSVSCTLSLLKSSVRTSSTAWMGKHRRQENDIRFSDVYGQFESIVTSTGQNDSGLFVLNFDDDRYLPFEGAGAISSWRIQLGRDFRQFDYSTISDVIVHVRYTAREGGAILRDLATSELKSKTLNAIALAESQNGLARLLSLRAEYPAAWYGMWNVADDGRQEMMIDLSNMRFPFVFREATINVEKIQLFVFVRKNFLPTHNAATLQFSLAQAAAPAPEPVLVLAPYSAVLGNRVFRASKAFARPAGMWKLSASVLPGGKVDVGAIEDVLLVCHYTVTGI